MVGTVFVVSVLLVYIIVERNRIEKMERKWIYSLTFITAGLSILFSLPYSLSFITEIVNNFIGSITKMVIS